MRILFLAPQPFFQERGTPIAVRLALKVLSERKGDSIELLTFAEGQDVSIRNVNINRIWSPKFLYGVRPGFSVKKLVCDFIFFFHALGMIVKSYFSGEKFALVHAVEESVFMALFFRVLFRIPYIYDMDSSLAMQLTEKLPCLRIFKSFFEWLESCAIRLSLSVIPVCDALAVIAQNKSAVHVQVLPDISLTADQDYGTKEDAASESEGAVPNLRKEAGLIDSSPVILYVGNLEHYQGVDLLIKSFAKLSSSFSDWHLIIIGGSPKHLESYKEQVTLSNLNGKIHLLGPRPVSQLSLYLKQANVLASPRTLGNNTPMKIYSYMHSGVAIIATDLPTHTQVLTSEMACLVKPDLNSFAKGLSELIGSEDMRARLAQRAFQEAEQKYTFPVFKKTLLEIYARVAERITAL